MHQTRIIGLLATFAVLLISHQAEAQTADYASMESLMQQPVTMSATGTPQTVSDVAANVTIITADQIRQSGSRSIPQILSRVPGLDILQETSTGYDVGVRGYQQPMQPSLLVLIDGRQVFSDDYSRTIWENLPVNIDDIRQIEVIKGASSALFGSNAAHGVINIITYNPMYDDNNVASVNFGTQTTAEGDATVSKKIGDYGGIKLSAGGMDANEFSTSRPANENAVTQDPEHRYVTANGVFQVAPKVQTFSELTYSKSTGTEAYYTGQLAGVTDTTYSIRGGFTWQSPIGNITSNNYLNHALVDNVEVSASLPIYNDTTTDYTSQLSDQFKIGSDHTFRASLEYNHKDFQLNGMQTLPTPASAAATSKIQEDNYSVGGMWLWQMTDDLAMTNAVRLDHMELGETGALVAGGPYTGSNFDTSVDALSANSGLVYKLTDQDTLRATYGRGIQMPSLLDYGFNSFNSSGSSTTTATERLGNPYLEPTVTTDYELGYDRKVPEIFSTAKVSAYYEVNQAIISPFSMVGMTTDGTFSTVRVREPTNIGNSDGVGGEFQVAGSHPDGYRWDFSYSYSAESDAQTVLTPPGSRGNNFFGYEHSTPYHHLRGLVGYTTGPWEMDLSSQVLTSRSLLRMPTSPLVNSAGYFTMGGRIGYKITDDITVAVSGTNVNQSEMEQSAYPNVERQVFLSLTTKF